MGLAVVVAQAVQASTASVKRARGRPTLVFTDASQRGAAAFVAPEDRGVALRQC